MLIWQWFIKALYIYHYSIILRNTELQIHWLSHFVCIHPHSLLFSHGKAIFARSPIVQVQGGCMSNVKGEPSHLHSLCVLEFGPHQCFHDSHAVTTGTLCPPSDVRWLSAIAPWLVASAAAGGHVTRQHCEKGNSKRAWADTFMTMWSWNSLMPFQGKDDPCLTL